MNTNQRLTRLNDQLNDRYVAENAWENVITYPKLVTLTTTLRCNYRCWMCYQPEFKGDMDWKVIERLRHVLPSVKTMQFFGGEPLLYPRLDDLCALAGQNECEIELITNGSLLDARRRALFLDNNASLIKISLEASTQPTYQAIRGGDLETVLSNIGALVRERDARGQKKPLVQINFVAMLRNIRELPDLTARAAAMGVDKILVLFAFAPGEREDIARETLYFAQGLSDDCMRKALDAAKAGGIELSVPGFFSDEADCAPEGCGAKVCHSPWKNCMIDLNGDVRFCCGLTGGPIGNLLESDFDELWYGEKITRFRRLVNTPAQPDCCTTCRVQGRNFRDIRFHVRNRELAERMLSEMAAEDAPAL